MAEEDFTVTSPTTELTFFRGVSDGHSECIQIDIIDDDVYEEEQEFSVHISSVLTSLSMVALGEHDNRYTLEDNTGMLLYYVWVNSMHSMSTISLAQTHNFDV